MNIEIDSDRIKDEIRKLKKEEQLRINKLENIKKNEARNDKKTKYQTTAMFDDFQTQLDELASFYQRTNFCKVDHNSNFISEIDLSEYESQEINIQDILENHLKNLKFNQEQKEHLDTNEEKENLRKKFQKSLYLKHESEMINIELNAELASLNAQISYLTNPDETSDNDDLDEIDRQIELVTLELSNSMKEICYNESLLEIYPDVETRLKEQTGAVQLMEKITEQYTRQLKRHNLRLNAIDQELLFHENLKEIFDVLASLSNDLHSMNKKLDEISIGTSSFDDSLSSKDEQLLKLIQNHFYENAPELFEALTTVESVEKALLKENCEKNLVLNNIKGTVMHSLYFLDKIYDNVNGFKNYIRKNTCRNINNKITLINNHNKESYLSGQLSAKNIKQRLREIKNKQEVMKLDIDMEE